MYGPGENNHYHHGSVKYYSPTELSRICRQNPESISFRESEPFFKRTKHAENPDQERHHRRHQEKPGINEPEEDFRRREKKEKRKHKRDYFEELPTYEQYYIMTHQQKDQKRNKKHKKQKIKEFSELNYQDLQCLINDYNRDMNINPNFGREEYNDGRRNQRSRSIDQIPTRDVTSEHRVGKRPERPRSAERREDSQMRKTKDHHMKHYPQIPIEVFHQMNDTREQNFPPQNEEMYLQNPPKKHKAKSKKKRKYIQDDGGTDFVTLDQINEQTMSIQDDRFERHKHGKWYDKKERQQQQNRQQREFYGNYNERLPNNRNPENNEYNPNVYVQNPKHDNFKTMQSPIHPSEGKEETTKDKRREKRKNKEKDKKKEDSEKDYNALKKYIKKLSKEDREAFYFNTKDDLEIIKLNNEVKKIGKDKRHYGEVFQQYFEHTTKQENELYNAERKKRSKNHRKEFVPLELGLEEQELPPKAHRKKHEHKKHKTKEETIRKDSADKVRFMSLSADRSTKGKNDNYDEYYQKNAVLDDIETSLKTKYKSESSLDSTSRKNNDVVCLYQSKDSPEQNMKSDTVKLSKKHGGESISFGTSKKQRENTTNTEKRDKESSPYDRNQMVLPTEHKKHMADVLNLQRRNELFEKALKRDFPTRPRPRLSRSRHRSSRILAKIDDMKFNTDEFKNDEEATKDVHCYDVGTSTILDNNFGDVLELLKGEPLVPPPRSDKKRSVFHVKKKASKEALMESSRKIYDSSENTIGIVVKGIEPPKKFDTSKVRSRFQFPSDKPKVNRLECKILSVVAIAPGKFENNVEELEDNPMTMTMSTPHMQYKDTDTETRNPSTDKRLERLLKYYKVEPHLEEVQPVKSLDNNKPLKNSEKVFKDLITSKLTDYLKKLQDDNDGGTLEFQTDNSKDPGVLKLVLPFDCVQTGHSFLNPNLPKESPIVHIPKESFSDLCINYSDANELEEENLSHQEHFMPNNALENNSKEINNGKVNKPEDFISGMPAYPRNIYQQDFHIPPDIDPAVYAQPEVETSRPGIPRIPKPTERNSTIQEAGEQVFQSEKQGMHIPFSINNINTGQCVPQFRNTSYQSQIYESYPHMNAPNVENIPPFNYPEENKYRNVGSSEIPQNYYGTAARDIRRVPYPMDAMAIQRQQQYALTPDPEMLTAETRNMRESGPIIPKRKNINTIPPEREPRELISSSNAIMDRWNSVPDNRNQYYGNVQIEPLPSFNEDSRNICTRMNEQIKHNQSFEKMRVEQEHLRDDSSSPRREKSDSVETELALSKTTNKMSHPMESTNLTRSNQESSSDMAQTYDYFEVLPPKTNTSTRVKPTVSRNNSPDNQESRSDKLSMEKSHLQRMNSPAGRKSTSAERKSSLAEKKDTSSEKKSTLTERKTTSLDRKNTSAERRPKSSQQKSIDFPPLESKIVNRNSSIPRRITNIPRPEKSVHSKASAPKTRQKNYEAPHIRDSLERLTWESQTAEGRVPDNDNLQNNYDIDKSELDNSLQKCLDWNIRNSATIVMSEFTIPNKTSDTEKSTDRSTVIPKRSNIPLAKKDRPKSPSVQGRSSSAGRDKNTSMFLTKTDKVAPGQSAYERRKMYDTRIRKNVKKRSLSESSSPSKGLPLIYEVRYFNVFNQCVPPLPDQTLPHEVKSDQNLSCYSGDHEIKSQWKRSDESLTTMPSCFLKDDKYTLDSKRKKNMNNSHQDESLQNTTTGVDTENDDFPKCNRIQEMKKGNSAKRNKRSIRKNKKCDNNRKLLKKDIDDVDTLSNHSSKCDRIQELIREKLLYAKYSEPPKPYPSKSSRESRKPKKRTEKEKLDYDIGNLGFKIENSNNSKPKSRITVKCSKKSSKENMKKLKIVAKVSSKQKSKILNEDGDTLHQSEFLDCQNLTKLSFDKVNDNELCVFFENQKLSSADSDCAESFGEKSVVSFSIEGGFSVDPDSIDNNSVSSKSTVINCKASSSAIASKSKDTIQEFESKEIIKQYSTVDSGYLTKGAEGNFSGTTLDSSNKDAKPCCSNIFRGISSKFSQKKIGIQRYRYTKTQSKDSRWNQEDLIRLKNQLLFPDVYDDFELLEAAKNTELIKYYVESVNDKLKEAIDTISHKEEMSTRSRSVISLPSVKMIPEENTSGINGDISSDYSCRVNQGGFYNYQKFIAQNNKKYSSEILLHISKPEAGGDGTQSMNDEELSETETASVKSMGSAMSKKSVIEIFKLRNSGSKRSSSTASQDILAEPKEDIETSKIKITDEEFFNNFHQIMAMECQKFAKKVRDQTNTSENNKEEEEFKEIPLDFILKNRNSNLENSLDCLDSEFQLASEEIDNNNNEESSKLRDDAEDNSSESFKSVTCVQENTTRPKRDSSTRKWQKLLKKRSSAATNSKFNLDFYPQERFSILDMIQSPQVSGMSADSLNTTSTKILDIIPTGEMTRQSEKQFFDNLLAFYDKESEFIKKLVRDEEFFVSLTDTIRSAEDATNLVYNKDIQKKSRKEKKKGILSRFFRWKDKKSTETLYESPSICKSLEFAKSMSGGGSITKESCYSFYKDLDDFEKEIPEKISMKIPNSDYLQQLAHKAKCHLEPMVKATMSNRHISDKIKLAGFLKLLDMVGKGDFTFFNNGDNKTLEDKLKDNVANMFDKVYRIANREVIQRNSILDNEKIQLLKTLVTKYHMGTDTHVNILAIYIGRGLINNKSQLEDAILYLMGLDTQEANLEEFEQNCGINNQIN